jgi:hypothetical protein
VGRLNKRVETLSAEVMRAKKQAEAVLGRAERAQADRDAERARAEALRTTIDELKAGQALMVEVQPATFAVAQHDAQAVQGWAAELRRGGAGRGSGTRGGSGECAVIGLTAIVVTAVVIVMLVVVERSSRRMD